MLFRSLRSGLVYGVKTLWTGFRLLLHRAGILRSKKFKAPAARIDDG